MFLLKIKQYLNNIYIYRKYVFLLHKRNVEKNPEKELERCYYPFFKKKVNWENPINLIEKTYWLLFNTDTSLWSKCADKYLVRKYIEECGFGNMVVKLYGKWDTANEIDFNSLPKRFVLKTNHSCGTCIVVRDKTQLNIKKIRKKLDRWLSIPYGYSGAQLHYTKIKPCIIAEEYLKEEGENQLLSPDSLIDYKIWCFSGEPESIWVAYNRTKNGVYMTLFDLDWREHPEYLISSDYYTYSDRKIKKPLCLDKMLEACRVISQPFPQVRIDFYCIDDKPIIGELTFTTGWGFFTYDYYDFLGSKIDIDNYRKV